VHGAPQMCSMLHANATQLDYCQTTMQVTLWTMHDGDALLANIAVTFLLAQGPNDMQLVTLKRREVAAAVVKDGESAQSSNHFLSSDVLVGQRNMVELKHACPRRCKEVTQCLNGPATTAAEAGTRIFQSDHIARADEALLARECAWLPDGFMLTHCAVHLQGWVTS